MNKISQFMIISIASFIIPTYLSFFILIANEPRILIKKIEAGSIIKTQNIGMYELFTFVETMQCGYEAQG